MFRKLFTLCLVIFFTVTTISFAQNQLDPRPLDPEIDPDIDMFMNSWQNSIPYNTHGSLTERAILTKWDGDPLKPERKGQVLTYVNRVTYAVLDAGALTAPTTLKGEQEVFYITSGEGVVNAGGKSAEIREGTWIFIPEGLMFTMTNNSDELMTMYLINEPTPEGFTPKNEMVIKDENTSPRPIEGFLRTHWCHNPRGGGIGGDDGLACMRGTGIITFDPMSIGHPHSHGKGWEEVWLVVEGETFAFLGKELRRQPPGTAYRVPPSEFTPHSNINASEEPVEVLLYIVNRSAE